MGEKALNFINSIISGFYGAEVITDEQNAAIREFIQNPCHLILQTQLDANKIILHYEVQQLENSIILFKSNIAGNDGDLSIKEIGVVIVSETAVETLYNNLKHVYGPLLLSKDNFMLDAGLQESISQLENGLKDLAFRQDRDKGNIRAILTIDDEIDYWNVFISENGSKKEKEAVADFVVLLEQINEELAGLHSLVLADIQENVENIGGLFDDIWRIGGSSYPQERMIRLFDIIGNQVISRLQGILSQSSIWETDDMTKSNDALTTISCCLGVIDVWISACKSLTELYWPNQALHPWTGGVYIPVNCKNFQHRLKQIEEIRSVFNQLMKLLSADERTELNMKNLLDPFKRVNAWICSPLTKPSWNKAVMFFTNAIRPAEIKVADKLKSRLRNPSTKQTLYEFVRYQVLIERPTMKHALRDELQAFVLSLGTTLKEIQDQIDSEESFNNHNIRPNEISPVVHQIQCAKHMEQKVKQIESILSKLMSDFDGASELRQVAVKLQVELKNVYSQSYDEWYRNLQAQLKSGNLQLAEEEAIVEFSKTNNLMRVNFNPHLVVVESEVRHLSACGMPPPAMPSLKRATDALHYARQLQRVSSFHNTSGSRLVNCLRPMLLTAALRLDALASTRVAWRETARVAQHVRALSEAAAELDEKNTYLMKQHTAIKDIVISLMGKDLLVQHSDWKKGFRDIRDIIDKTEKEGFTESSGWRSHWDAQLREALRVQYLETLTQIHNRMPQTQVHLQARGENLVFMPPMEEIRGQQYRTLRRLVSLPEQFSTLQGIGSYSSIIAECSGAADVAAASVESTLARADDVRVGWRRRVGMALFANSWHAPARTDPEDFTRDYRACRTYARTVADMSFEDERVDWIVISVGSLRREMDNAVRALWSTLVASLRNSCLDDISSLEEFLLKTKNISNNETTPSNAQELVELSSTFNELVDKTPEMQKLIDALKIKQSMLRNWGGEPLSDGPLNSWQQWLDTMRSQEKLFQHQTERVQRWLASEWERVTSLVESWHRRENNRASRPPTLNSYEDLLSLHKEVSNSNEEWQSLMTEREKLLTESEHFNMKLSVGDEWTKAEKVYEQDSTKWQTFSEFNEELKGISEQLWLTFQKRLHSLDEFVNKWEGKLVPNNSIELFLQNHLEHFKDLTPTLKYLRNTDLNQKHWAELISLLEIDRARNVEELLVGHLLGVAANIKRHAKIIQKITSTASSEAMVAQSIQELELWFAAARLTVTYCKDRHGKRVPIVADFNIMTKIEEQCWRAESLATGAGGTSLSAWAARCRSAARLATCLHRAQRRWLYLEPILSGDDGELGRKFRSVDHGFRQIALSVESDSRLAALLRSPRLQATLDNLLEQLASCQTALNDYIKEKREVFPRFYFLSDDDLLEILGQARTGSEGRETIIQTHLTKLFPGASSVVLGKDAMSITALVSKSEEFTLEKPVGIDCAVEIWLKNLEDEMRRTMKALLLKCLTLDNHNSISFPIQILMLAQNIRFTELTEKAIVRRDLQTLKEKINSECNGYIDNETEHNEGEEDINKRRALALQCIHFNNILNLLIENNVTSAPNWLWQKQLRFYQTREKSVVAKMGAAQMEYTYEYLGSDFGQFVRTETAETCFFILTQALHLELIGNPFGPAGTGKTESVKALGGLLGRLVLVFNCDEAMDEACIRRIVKGLELSGAWGCLDEFNRLSEESMATLAAIYTNALRKSGAIICTMNPAGGAYGGRRTITAHSALLRPVAAAHASPLHLATAMLRARGVPNADRIAQGLASALSLASEVLTDREHYDWGVRTLKPLLSCANPAKALRTNALSKLTAFDAHGFDAILKLVFPDESFDDDSDAELDAALKQSYVDLNLKYNERQFRKCKEIYEHLKTRMGIAIIGPPGAGKTTIRRLLKNALTIMGWNIVEHTVCPMAMSRRLLLGYMEHDTRQWRDGVISTIAQTIASQPELSSWLVLDGEPEPKWAEALNSVLDDNRVLTLGAGWRVHFPPMSRLILEAPHLHAASPATVSRLAITLLDTQDSCPLELMGVWLSKEETTPAVRLLQESTQAILEWISINRAVQQLEPVTLVRQIMVQFFGQELEDLDVNTDEARVSAAISTALYGHIKPKLQLDFLNQIESSTGQRAHARDDLCGVRSALKLQQHLAIIGRNNPETKFKIDALLRDYDENTILHVKCTPVLEPHQLTRLLKMHGAMSGTAVTLVADDVDRARKDSSGIAPLHDFLLQLVQYGGVWEGEGAEGARWTPARVRLLLCAPPSRLPPRLLNLLSVHYAEQITDDDDYHAIIMTLLEENVGKVSKELDLKELSKRMIDAYKEFSQVSPICSSNDLRKWTENLHNYTTPNAAVVAHEAICIFADRLSSSEEKSKIAAILRKHFKSEEGICYMPRNHTDTVMLEACKEEDWYNIIRRTIDQCETEIDNIFGDCGAEVSDEFVQICNAIVRTLADSMCTVIVDSDGSCARATRSVCAEMLGARCFTAHASDNLNALAQALVSAGTEDKRTLLLCEESANVSREENILGYIEAVLASQIYQLEDQSLLHQNVNSYDFWKCIKRNLGIIILLDSANPNIEELFEDYPMLYEKCHTLWLNGQSKNTLTELPEKIVIRQKKMSSEIDGSVDFAKALPIDGFLGIYTSLKSKSLTTLYKYMIFVKSFYNIKTDKAALLNRRRKTLTGGLVSLKKAKTQVDEMKKDAAIQESALSEKQEKANAALEQISSTVTSATEHREEMEKLKITIQKENEQLQKEAAVIEAELADAEPGLAQARAAVADIKPEALTEIRSLRAPPDTVRDVLEGVLLLMNINDTSWHSMKIFLSKRGIKEDIRNLDVSTVPPTAIAAAERLIAARPTSFLPATVRRASAAAAPLAAWLSSALQYARAHTRLAPLRSRQAALRKNLKQAEAQLENLTGGLLSADERVATLKEQLNRYTKEAMEIEFKLSVAKETIHKAETLVRMLEGESSTWEEDLETLSSEISELDVRSLLSAAYLNFQEEEKFHNGKIIDFWCNTLGYDKRDFTVTNFLSSTEEQLQWIANGLPNEETSLQNAVIIAQYLKETKRGATPLVLDPDETALDWLRNTYTQADILSQHNEHLNTALLHATRFGKILIITEVTHISDSWAPLVRGLLPNGFSSINSNFRLILHTKDVTLIQRLYSHHHCVLTVVEFTPTYLGIVDKLINHTIEQVKPELKESLDRLKNEMATLEKERHQSQDLLSEALAKEPDLIRDTETAAILEQNASRALEAKKAANEALRTNKMADSIRQTLVESAGKATKGLLAARTLESIPPVPTSDLALLYGQAISQIMVSRADLEEVNSPDVTKHVTEELIQRILLCVPKSDKYAVALLILKEIHPEEITHDLWETMLRSNMITGGNELKQLKAEVPWLNDENVPALLKLKTARSDIYQKLHVDDAKMWSKLKETDDSRALNSLGLKPFEKVVVAQCLALDSVHDVVKQFVESYAGSVRGGLSRSIGAHMRRAICARGHGGAHAMLTALTSHQPQTILLEDTTPSDLKQAIEESSKMGRWLLVLVGTAKCDPACMALLTDQNNFTNEHFKLWIVFEDREVPPYVANACVNVLLEPPSGVKNNVLQTLSAWEKDGNTEIEKVRSFFSLALLHAMVQERRNYIPEGWSQWYAWEWSDVVASRGAGPQSALALYSARVLKTADLRTLRAVHEFCKTAPPPRNTFTDYARWISDNEPNAAPAGQRHNTNLNRTLLEISSTRRNEVNDLNSIKRSLMAILSLWKKMNAENAPLLKGELDFEKIVSNRVWRWSEAMSACESRGAQLAARLHAHLARAHFASHTSLARDLATDKVPNEWQQIWPGPQSLIQYIKEVSHRATFLMKFFAQPRISDDDFLEMDLRSLFYPQKFMAILKCQTAETLKCSPEELQLEVNWNVIKPERGWCVCSGCRLWGGEWRSGLITPGRSSTEAPKFAVKYQQKVTEGKPAESWKKIPLYTNGTRQQLVCMLPAPIDDTFNEITWVLQATALYISEVSY